MSAVPKPKMTVDQFLDWAKIQPGRYELHGGELFAMSPETVGHAEIKGLVHAALLAGIRRKALACHALPDGATVRIDDATSYEPDALVYCGPKLNRTTIEVSSAVIVVEVLSTSTRHVDLAVKLVGYFQVPSIRHYLIVDPDQPVVTHHARAADGTIITRILREGSIGLDPPGLEIALADIYA